MLFKVGHEENVLVGADAMQVVKDDYCAIPTCPTGSPNPTFPLSMHVEGFLNWLSVAKKAQIILSFSQSSSKRKVVFFSIVLVYSTF